MSFRLKIVLGIVTIQVLLLIILIWSSFHFLRTSNEVELSNRATATASLYAATIRVAMRDEDLDVLQQVTNDVLAQPGVEYVRVRRDGKLLLAAGNESALARPFSEDFLVEDVDDGIFDVSVQVADAAQIYGDVEMGYSLLAIESVMVAARRETAAISVVGMGISILFSLMLGNYFARQLKSLRNASRRIAAGDIGYQLAVSGADELAQTANSFNTMSRRLALLYSEKQAALNDAKENAADLRESERRIHAVLNNVLDGIITIDEYGTVESFNPAAEQIFGYEASEVIGNNIKMLMPEHYASEHDEYLRRYVETGKKHIMGTTREVEGKRKDGEVFPMELDVSEVQIEGRYLFIGIARDITERKNTEMALREAKDAALESAKNKFEFIANVSHEIRTPINGVLSTINLLLESELTVAQKGYVDKIHASGDALITVINDVLDFSKIEAGSLSLEEIDFDLHRTVEVVYRMLRKRAMDKDLKFFYEMPSSVPIGLVGDPTRLRQVLLNLLDNAIKYTESGEVGLKIAVESRQDDALVLRFDVVDTGIGISEAMQARLQELFSQEKEPVLRPFGGTGLGLMICKNLVRMLHGEIGIESKLGQGSRFWFTTTLREQAGAAPAQESSYDELQGARVLVVEETESGRAMLMSALTSAGVNVRAVEDGSRALDEMCRAAARGMHYDLLIFDMMMPGMNGIQLARTVRSDNRISSVRMLMVATTGYRGDSEEVRRAGINGYLSAPFEQVQLFDSVLAVLRLDPADRLSFITRHNIAARKGEHRGHVLLAVQSEREKREFLQGLEAADYRVSYAATGTEVLAAVAKPGRYSFALIDSRLQDMDGGELMREIRRREGGGYHLPVIALVAADVSSQEQDRLRADGVNDCLEKPLDITTLRERVG